jgi:hypothetical protein
MTPCCLGEIYRTFEHEDGGSTSLENTGKLYVLALRHITQDTLLFIITESSNRIEQSCSDLQQWFVRTVHTHGVSLPPTYRPVERQ